jgi:prenylcysteine alpha-carboxyl methylesterase
MYLSIPVVAWGALFARRLSQRGILVFCLDYRNFPQGTITDMVQDCNHGISWVLNNCHLYGGDPNSVYLVGQSAGVHLTLLALIAQSKRHVEGGYPLCSVPSWNPKRLVGYIGVSGAYNLVTLADHLHHRGLYRNIFSTIMSTPDGRNGVMEFSPTLIADTLPSNVIQCIPPMTLFHGTSDKSVPVDNAIQFCQAMKIAGGSCKLHLYHEKTHTQPIVEDPMRGGRDKLMDDVLSVIRHEDCFNQQFPMVPNVLIDAATFVCPF